MKKFIKEYLGVLAYTTIGFVLIISSFYLLMNYYHKEELNKVLYITENDVNYQNYLSKIERIERNLTKFQNKKSTNKAYTLMYNKLSTCHIVLTGEGTFYKFPVNTYINSYDVYKLGARFQSDILNVCYAMHLSYLKDENLSDEFKSIAPYVISSIETITSQSNFALKELQNNSSYFYSTNITSSTIRNYLSSDYQVIVNSYLEFADIILALSEEINKDVVGGYNG